MIGIFDSGAGGLASLQELRKISATADVVYLADSKNAPYGTKSEAELVTLAEQCILRLADCGCEHILIACCTASTVHRHLSTRARAISTPIIAPAAFAAAHITRNGKIGVIATEATVRSGQFKREIERELPACHVISVSAQPLVSMVEAGERDGALSPTSRDIIGGILTPISEAGVDTLVLGCTHFSHLAEEIRALTPGVRLVLPSREGVWEVIRKFGTELLIGTGATVYINT